MPLVVLVGLVLWQAVVAGQAASLTASAARAAARAAALDADLGRAARAVLPPRLHDGLRVVRRSDGSVRVWVRVPSVVGSVSVATVSSRARFAPQGEG